MEIKDKVNFWLDSSKYDLKTAIIMHDSARYVYTVYMCQQSIEKLIKAIYLQNNKEEAPRSHNLSYLIGLIKTGLNESQLSLLAELSTFYLEGRYPTYKEKISKLVNKQKSSTLLKQTLEIIKCLKSLIK